jgi:asparagine synthetase B (glutamine-hydrolysing)
MQASQLVEDARIARGRIWNVAEVVRRFPLGAAADPWNSGVKISDEAWLDEFIHRGFHRYGEPFLSSLKGRFATAHFDPTSGCLFLARDWVGELPLHVLATRNRVIVANTIRALREAAGNLYNYTYVRAFPHAHAQEIDLADADPDSVALSMRPREPLLYADFAALVQQATYDVGYELDRSAAEQLRGLLLGSVTRRAAADAAPHAVLLSGGLDSFSVALAMKALGQRFEAYTLSVNGAGDDARMAAEFAGRLGVTHHVVRVTSEEVIDVFEEAILASESYHLYNVYCAAGMLLLGKGLQRMGVRSAFCGEAVNEAVGDYKSWEVTEPGSGRTILLQRINSARLQRVEERQLLVWGHPRDKGKYNKQLGTGLAKHAGSRMVKPFLAHQLTLECPYYDPQLLAHLVATPSEVLDALGGKPGLFATVFERDLQRFGISRDLIESCKKVRLQDASEGGAGGITTVLLAAGCDQRRTIDVFNRCFGASLDPDLEAGRLATTDLRAGAHR